MAQLTLNLPESLLDHARFIGQVTHRDAEAVLTDMLEMMWPAWANMLKADFFPHITALSDFKNGSDSAK